MRAPTIETALCTAYTPSGMSNPSQAVFLSYASQDTDALLALNGRWYFRPDIALVTGYELGKITFWKVGVRFTF